MTAVLIAYSQLAVSIVVGAVAFAVFLGACWLVGRFTIGVYLEIKNLMLQWRNRWPTL